jgi:ABC-type bacteriocin/lantibiotic exporter with double-glycine peptidase domain
MYPCTKGIITIDGIQIDQIDPDILRQQITYVNQTSKLFDKKIMENILYGCPLDSTECQDTLREILPDLDTDKDKGRMTDKYPKIRHLFQSLDIEKKGSGSLGENLSGGQCRVIHILGGLIHPSKILILDEPTNALDPGLKMEVLRLIMDFKRRKQCILIITHDEHVFSLFDEKIQI